MNALKTTINIPWLDEGWQGRRTILKGEDEAYSKVPLIYRAVKMRVQSLSRVPVYVYQGDREEPIDYEFENELPLHDLIALSETAILLKGAAYVLKNQNSFGLSKGLQWVNPFTMHSKINDNGQLVFWQEIDGKRYPSANGFWTADEMIYMRDFNPTDDTGAGISATAVALGDAKILASVTQFLGNFFTNDGLPVTLITLPKGASDAERDRAENWFKTKLRQSVERILAIRADVKVDKLTAELKTFDFAGVDTHAIQNVCWSFSMPKTVLTSDSANFATASTEYRSFLDYTIIPRCNYFERILNPFLAEFGQRIKFAPEEMPEMQEDEAKRAASLKMLVDAGVPLDAALDILGYNLSDLAQAAIDKKLAEPPPAPVVDPTTQDPQTDTQDTQVKTELDKWKRKAIKAIQAGKPATVEFLSDVIPEATRIEFAESLKSCKTEGDVWKIMKP